jgi:hypothetical protein
MPLSDRSSLALEPDPLVDAVVDAMAARRARGDDMLELAGSMHEQAARRRALEAGIARQLAEEGVPVEASRVVCVGSVGAAFELVLTVSTDPGDEVLVPEPGLPEVARLASLSGVSVAPYPLASPFDGGQPDPMALWDAVGERTRALVVAHPALTGAYVSADAAEALAAFEVPWIVDETGYPHPLDLQREPSRLCPPGLGFTVGTTRSEHHENQAHIVVHGPAQAADEAVRRLRALTELRDLDGGSLAGTPYAGATQRDRARDALAALREAVADTVLGVPRLEGGRWAPIRAPRRLGKADALVLALAERGVHVRSGTALGFAEHETWVVLDLLTPLDVLRRGLERMRDALDASG